MLPRALLASLVLLAAACPGNAPASKVRPPPLVTAAPVTVEDVPVVIRAPTDLRPREQADVGAKVIGYLDAVLVDRGDVVKKGQLLALVRPSDLPDQLAAARNAVAQAEASRALAKSNLERATTLAPQGLVSQQELQSATAASAAAEAQLGSAQSQLSALAVRLGETRLESPFDGVVLARRLDPGALAGPATPPVLTVGRVDVLRAFVAVNESRSRLLAVGQPARVRVDVRQGEVFSGRIERLAPAYDAVTRTLDAEIFVPNPDGLLRPGMYGRAELEVGRHPHVPVVPVEAVQVSDEKAYVFVLKGDAVERVLITLGEDLGERLEVASGLKGTETIVVRGIDGLATGSKVRVAHGTVDGGVPPSTGSGLAPPGVR